MSSESIQQTIDNAKRLKGQSEKLMRTAVKDIEALIFNSNSWKVAFGKGFLNSAEIARLKTIVKKLNKVFT